MPPRSRSSKPAKGLKENINVVVKSKVISTGKVTKPTRRALADKTNSASDDNTSVELPKKGAQKPIESSKPTKLGKGKENVDRPRRDRRLPSRFVENIALKNLSNSKDAVTPESLPTKAQTPVKSVVSVNSSTESPFKTPQKPSETSLVANRPRRICRLPSKFEDHSISPSKFIPVQPVQASTPKLQKNTIKSNDCIEKDVSKRNGTQKVNNDKVKDSKTKSTSSINKKGGTLQSPKAKTITKVNDTVKKADTKPTFVSQGRTLRNRNIKAQNVSPKTPDVSLTSKKTPEVTKKTPEVPRNKKSPRKQSPKKTLPVKQHLQTSFSFRVLDDNNSPKEDKNKDVYEFTFDPNEEPAPQKKKKKRVVKKRPPKPKTVVFKNNYDLNLAKTMTALKGAVSKKVQEKQPDTEKNVPTIQNKDVSVQPSSIANNSVPKIVITTPAKELPSSVPEKSIQIEDIAADFETSLDHQDINYSPVNSPQPNRPMSPVAPVLPLNANINDPLNLRENLSFFDDQPVASSSMNVSARHPEASPWRIEFESLPIKWHVNSYVKPNMTPAVECSFVNFEDNKKKHVYTNMLPDNNEVLPEIVDKNPPNLVQSSIISFIKEVVEKNNKKKAKTPTRNIFDDVTNNQAIDNVTLQTRKVATPRKNTNSEKSTSDISNISDDRENSDKVNSREYLKRKNNSNHDEVPAKTPRNEDDAYFGFDESEDQENVSPKEIDSRKTRGLRTKARAVLKEINRQGPTRAALPLAAKTTASEAINKLYEEMKSANDAPVFPEKDALQNEPIVGATNIDLNEDSDSVHLFEDIEVVHHLKPHRKSYGKAKKVAFRQSSSDYDSQDTNVAEVEATSGEEDDFNDLTFEMPVVEKQKKPKKKQTKKQKLTKKERQEADAWAANFNSMCEDVEDFPLLVE